LRDLFAGRESSFIDYIPSRHVFVLPPWSSGTVIQNGWNLTNLWWIPRVAWVVVSQSSGTINQTRL
jgi:hypothetical protein